MPMGSAPLDAVKLGLIRAWIDSGAEWPNDGDVTAEIKKHWAYIPPVRPALPKVRDSKWPLSPIDNFVLSRLEKEELSPSPQADAAVLLRRLSLDLTGLPPSVEEVDAFLNDKSKNAYEKQVERLLTSPHYGERWAQQWLDGARYADSNGFEKDKPRQVWFYRDWVINALQRDLPYDRFIIEQVAGDLLPNAAQEQIVATGFLRNSMINEEGGIDPEQFRMEATFDRMDAIGKTVLGITTQCAQCHNHKYDPLLQEDYYRMLAFINNSDEASVGVYIPQEQGKRADLFLKIQEIEDELQRRNPGWQERMEAWAKKVKDDQPEWTALRLVVDDTSAFGQKYRALKDDSLLAGGFAATKTRLKLTARTEIEGITAFRLELLNDPNLPFGGPGRSDRGTCALTEFEVGSAPANGPGKTVKVKIARATADINLPEAPLQSMFDDKSGRSRVIGPVEFAIDSKEGTAWGVDEGPVRRNLPRKAVFNAAAPVSHPGGTILTFELSQNHGGGGDDSQNNNNNNLGRFRLSVTTAADAKADPVPARVREILAIPPERRAPEQVRAIFSYWRTTVPEWQSANARIEALWREHPEGASQLVLRERELRRETHILTRGDFLQPGRVVEPGVPAFLHPLPANAPPNRLTFANWLVDRKSPTAARSMVNRIWQAYFGTGLVSTAENLGKQGERPSHTELLDWLAVEFMDRGWSLKTLHRTIVTSAAYRQSSRVTPELYTRDPDNRLLARGPRLRVEAETVRDIALAASGLLNPKVGGPSVFPPAPEFLFTPPVSYSRKSWAESKGDDRYRRAVYTFRYRSVPYPMLQTFDAPNGDVSCVRRARSNTPLQALTTLNEPLFLESARALALRVLREAGDTDDRRITYAFRRCVSRTPTEKEKAEVLAFLGQQTPRLAEGWLNAWELAGISPAASAQLPKGATPAQLAAWTAVARLLLNLDETITKE